MVAVDKCLRLMIICRQVPIAVPMAGGGGAGERQSNFDAVVNDSDLLTGILVGISIPEFL